MYNILLPAMGKSTFFKDYYFPKLMLEIDGETVLEKVVMNYSGIADKHFIFVLSQKDCTGFHLDQSAKIVAGRKSSVLVLKNETAGALCTCLLAIDEINNEQPLVIANCDQVIDVEYNLVLEDFRKRELDAGVITFPSIHPRWSYARLEQGRVIEFAEKRPISKHAVAGIYFYRHGWDFVETAKRVILKGHSFQGNYYLSASMNEMILMNKKIGLFEIEKRAYHSFYSPEKIREYEAMILGGGKKRCVLGS